MRAEVERETALGTAQDAVTLKHWNVRESGSLLWKHQDTLVGGGTEAPHYGGHKERGSVLPQPWVLFVLKSEQFPCFSEWGSGHRAHLSTGILRSKVLWFEYEMSPVGFRV